MYYEENTILNVIPTNEKGESQGRNWTPLG